MSINATKTLKIIAERASPQNKSHERISKKQSKPITKQLSINWDEKVEKLFLSQRIRKFINWQLQNINFQKILFDTQNVLGFSFKMHPFV